MKDEDLDYILEGALNAALWCLPDTIGAVRVDRVKLRRIKERAIKEIKKAMNNERRPN
jgi:hypothetical protein